MRIDKVSCPNTKNHNFRNFIAADYPNTKIQNNIKKDIFIKSSVVNFKGNSNEKEKPTLFDHLLSDDNFHFKFLTDGSDPYYYADCPRLVTLGSVWGKQDLRGHVTKFERSKTVNLLSGSDEEIARIADGICLYGEDDIYMFCAYPNKFLGIEYGINEDLTNCAYLRLNRFVKENKHEIETLKQGIRDYEQTEPRRRTKKQRQTYKYAVERLNYLLKEGQDFQKNYIDLRVIRDYDPAGGDISSFYPSGNY